MIIKLWDEFCTCAVGLSESDQDASSSSISSWEVVLRGSASYFEKNCKPPSFLSPVVVELLIVAHDCFSLTCNMEGIVRVLQAARHLSHTYLAPGGHYSLLVSPQTQIHCSPSCWCCCTHVNYCVVASQCVHVVPADRKKCLSDLSDYHYTNQPWILSTQLLGSKLDYRRKKVSFPVCVCVCAGPSADRYRQV